MAEKTPHLTREAQELVDNTERRNRSRSPSLLTSTPGSLGLSVAGGTAICSDPQSHSHLPAGVQSKAKELIPLCSSRATEMELKTEKLGPLGERSGRRCLAVPIRFTASDER